MASTSHNPTSPPPTRWDVFLSFRGEDTRYSFTAHLYTALCRTGIKTFMDDPELRSGEVISDSLIQAIQGSNTHIVVLSKNYASSSWCLGELEEILACYRPMGRLVIPVFYHIDPSVVRHQTSPFQEAFEKHQTRFDLDKVNKWRSTLKEVAAFSGFHVSENRSEADVIKEVVDRISLKINPKTLHVAKYPTGLDSRVKDITALLNSDTGVIRIGIHGMGGVGKTTLAKAVYNKNYQQFQGSCFLANVREVSGTENGVVSLQHQLIVDVLECNNFNIGNKDQGIELIRKRICSTKVLVVIDDLDNPKPLEYLDGSFAMGSVIVITTRNEDLLNSIKVQTRYKVNELDDDESHQLFAQHAFGDDKIPCTFAKMSKEILQRARGLPLALQVFGSNLLEKSEEKWKQFINKLSRVPIDDIEKKLMLSFDALKSEDPMLQDIFLDIACFHIGKPKEQVVEILGTCYTFVDLHIDFLSRRCLLTMNDWNILWMHDLLRDMGRRIAHNNCPDDPGKHSRLWVAEDIKTVLKNNKGTEAIQGIHFYNLKDQEVKFDDESFKRMSNLRLLYLNNANITGSFEKTFENLRWLCWDNCPLECLPSEFYPQKLVTLELRNSKMKAMWEPNMVPGVLEKLKTLNMRGSRNLTTTPDFTRLPCLETLDLSGCESLKEVHVSIGSLVSLVSLDLVGCKNLISLPDSICSLRTLEVLNIRCCEKLEELPDLSQLSNIEDLDLRDCSDLLCIVGLPPNLKQIRANGRRSLKRLPNLSHLKQLKELNLWSCEVLTEIQGLEELTGLQMLDLHGCDDLHYISGLPPNLESIRANGCRSLKRLPNLSHLKQLKTLNLGSCEVLTEIQGLEELTCLQLLYLDGCYDLHYISGLPPNLESISANGCRSLKRLPNLSHLKQLKTLNLGSCEVLTEIQGLEELTGLQMLDLHGCDDLHYISGLPPNLESIRANGCRSLKRLPNLSHLKQLKTLNLGSCEVLTEIQGLEELTCLQLLYLDGCYDLHYISGLPPNLESISANGCRSLKRLPNLSHLKQLKTLNLGSCEVLTEIQGLEELICLQMLDFDDCYDLHYISGLPPNLEYIWANGCRSLKRLPNLSHLKQLKTLNIRNCTSLTEIQGLNGLTSIKQLALKGCNWFILAFTLTIRFFQILSGFGHTTTIEVGSMEIPRWMSESSKVRALRMSFDLQPNASHNLMGIIFYFYIDVPCMYELNFTYSMKNIRSGFIRTGKIRYGYICYTSLIVIVPSSILSIGDGHNTLEVTSDTYLNYGIHLVYETEIKMISGYNSTTVNVEDERSKPSDNDLESNKKLLTLGSSSTTVNLEDERSNNDLESKMKRLTLASSSTNVNVEEGRSPPSKRLKRLCDSNCSLCSNV